MKKILAVLSVVICVYSSVASGEEKEVSNISTNSPLSEITITQDIVEDIVEDLSIDNNLFEELEKINDNDKDIEIKTKFYQEGKASFYAGKFHGRKTASGEIFDTYALTAAHKSLPLGTIVKVTNIRNDKSVIVKINDRGPYIHGRIIDLSTAAFQSIGNIDHGVLTVKIDILDDPVNDNPKNNIIKN